MNKHYSRYFCLLICLKLFFASAAIAQYGNEWIVPGQSYYKIPISSNGIYAITYNDLQTAGISGVDPRKFQLFHRGVEQAILVKGEDDAVFSPEDSILFYGKGNDGTLDSILYLTSNLQPHKFYNLYSDTTAYFLTWSTINGKRMSLINGTASAADPYHFEKMLYVYSNDYSKGQVYGEANITEGDVGEGWCSSMIYTNGTSPAYLEQIIPISNLATSGPAAELEILLIGRNNNNEHTVQILLGNDRNNPDTTYSVPVFAYQNIKKLNLSVPHKYLLSGNLKVNVKVVNREVNLVKLADGVSAGYIKLTYPQLTNLTFGSSKNFYLINPSSSSTLEIGDSPSTSMVFDISNTNSIAIVNASFNGSTLSAHLPANTNTLLVTNHSAFKSLPSLSKVDLSGYSHQNTATYIIISHKKLMASAKDYAAYRAGVGGGHDTLIADVEKLFNLYTYGERTPLAIRRFCKDLIDHGVPEYLLIIGKGLLVNYSGATNSGSFSYRKNPTAFIFNTNDTPVEDLVPTAGIPGSDLLFSMGLGGKPKYVAALATGRIPARTDSEVRAYLAKVKEHEALPSNLLWRKHMVHLSGGANVNELARFKSYVNYFKSIAEDTIFGGKVVRTLTKNLGSGPIDEKLKYSLAEEMNKGLSCVTFFGHSSANVIDVDIGNVSNPLYGYNNKGKYPLLFVNGCSSANVFARASFAEDWIVTADKGAIVVIGHSDIGYENELYSYTNTFYTNTFSLRKYAGKSIGLVQKQVIHELDSMFGSFTSGIRATTLEQMTLQGDPAVVIYSPEQTDYAIGNENVFIKSLDGNPVTAVSDSFAIGIAVTNYGITYPDSIGVNIVRTYGGKEVSYETVLYKPINYLDTLYFIIKSKDQATYGVNKFSIKIDYYDSVPEFNEMNNTAELEYFMPLSGVACLYPKEFSIVNTQPVQFIAQSTDLLIGERDYWIELDTSYFFNSSIRKTATIRSGSLIKWTSTLLADINTNDSIVYYWRVRFNEIPVGEDTLWGTSSFIYIKDSPEGWSQSQFWQFKKDQKNNINDLDASKSFDFSGVTTKVHIKTYGDSISSTGYLKMEVVLNDGIVVVFPGFGFCNKHGLLAMTFDKNTVQPYLPVPTPNCGRGDNKFINNFVGLTSPTVQTNLINYLRAVKDGDYVLLFSSSDASYSYWKNSELGDSIRYYLGANLLDSLNDKAPYIILAKKGAGAPIVEMYSPYTSASLTLDHVLTGKFNNGYITSTLIGPSQNWGKFYRTVDMNANDLYNIQVHAIGLDGNTSIINIPQSDSLNLGSYIDATQYPYIKLYASLYDSSVTLDPPQLKKWQVIYSGVPEGTMNPSLAGLDQYKVSTRNEGDSITINYVFENISTLDFPDTVKVKFSIRNESGVSRDTIVKLGILKRDGSFSFSHTFSTIDLEGNNTIQAFVNPRLQPEEYYNNNIIETSFNVDADKTNPVLDVVFDGVHIMDGDIVSPSPLITITIKDENKFLYKNSTDGMEVFLKRPGQSDFEKIELGSNSDIISVGQASGKANHYVIQYNPKNLPDGLYSLRVQGTDASGNKSGVEHYEIKFEVINKSTITHFYPYPNPFSTSTRFVFTLTGSEIPEDLKIQIMTISGKVVREITKSELGPIRIGNNKSEYAWDGTDEFGDRLANGVYLYRVIIKNQGENFSHRDSAGDKAFKKEFGKLYILR